MRIKNIPFNLKKIDIRVFISYEKRRRHTFYYYKQKAMTLVGHPYTNT